MTSLARPAPSSRTACLVLLTCVAVGAAVRFLGLTRESFWLDEGWSLYVIDSASRADVLRGSMDDVHPPLSFMPEWGRMRSYGPFDAAMGSRFAVCSMRSMGAARARCRRLDASAGTGSLPAARPMGEVRHLTAPSGIRRRPRPGALRAS